MILLVATLLCHPATAVPAKNTTIIHKISPEATFKQRWLALHFRELVK